MKRITTTIDIEAPAHDVYLALRALDAYPGWLRPSLVYRRTRTNDRADLAQAASYEDATTVGRMPGRLLAEVTDRTLHFHQATRSGSVDADIRYDMDAGGGTRATRVSRVGELTTHGVFRVMQPVLLRMAAAEGARTMRALKTHVEGDGCD